MLSESERHGPPTHQASQLLGTQQGAKYVQRMEQSNKIIQRENEERYGRKTTTHVSHGGTLPPTSLGDDDNNDVLTLIAKSRLALMLLLLFQLWELLFPTKLY